MQIGAQLYSVRNFLQNPEDFKETFRKVKEMGYQAVQLSGMGEIDPYFIRDVSQEYDLPITVTHNAPVKLRENLDKVIEDHKIFGCPVVGLGSMPTSFRDGTFASLKTFYDEYYDISRRIEDKGLKFAYHNHNFEFNKLDNGRTIFDFLAEENDNWDIIADICWISYAGQNVNEVLRKFKGRLRTTHLKDIKNYEGKDFCPLGEGIVDNLGAIPTLIECGCEYTHVEQDNAVDFPDPFEQLRISAEYLKKKGLLEAK